jgi:ribosomal protein S18 acetylase RimI-like enzyme
VIEPGRTEDADQVADLWVELASDQLAHGSHLRPEANRERIRDSILRHAVAGTLFVVREDDIVVGFVTFSVETGGYDQDVRRGVVENIYVAEGHRDEGVGAALLRAAERTLSDRGCEAVGLDVMAANEGARRFYERHGYAAHRVEMERRLDGTEN